jgi:hypothetical protein
MKCRLLPLLGVAVLSLATSAFADTYTYVGSWAVDQGPSWTTRPEAETGQGAAALLFGGTASDYIITTVFGAPSNADAWYSTYDSGGLGLCGGSYPCGTIAADNTDVTNGGYYDTTGDTSSYVSDWAVGSEYTNYAYLVTKSAVPEPASVILLLTTLLAVAFLARKRIAQNL